MTTWSVLVGKFPLMAIEDTQMNTMPEIMKKKTAKPLPEHLMHSNVPTRP